mmetsp:Transcript_22312/g.47029  ORF Transcript_22312/g.47029 Transcript_22312/m.47029 type:complete len:216 (-) Transcript_22312:114-761(-)
MLPPHIIRNGLHPIPLIGTPRNGIEFLAHVFDETQRRHNLILLFVPSRLGHRGEHRTISVRSAIAPVPSTALPRQSQDQFDFLEGEFRLGMRGLEFRRGEQHFHQLASIGSRVGVVPAPASAADGGAIVSGAAGVSPVPLGGFPSAVLDVVECFDGFVLAVGCHGEGGGRRSSSSTGGTGFVVPFSRRNGGCRYRLSAAEEEVESVSFLDCQGQR